MKVTAKSNIKHNGHTYKAGELLNGVTEDQAAQLLEAGVVEVEGQAPKTKKKEEAPDRSIGTPDDKKAEQAGIEEVANLPIKANLGKEKLRGIALANGLEVEKTATPAEIYNMIKEHRIANGIVVEGDPKTVTEEAEATNKEEGESEPEVNDSKAPETAEEEKDEEQVDEKEELKNQDGETVEGDEEVASESPKK